MDTFSTSKECGKYAGMRVVDDNSFPDIESIDLYRECAYSDIYEEIDSGDDVNSKAARKAELFLVKIMIDNVRYKRAVIPEIPEKMLANLTSATDQIGITTFEPGKDN